MGAPGTLIPAEAPSGHLQNLGLDGRTITTVAAVGIGSFSALDQGARDESSSSTVDETAKTGSSSSESPQVATASSRNEGRFAGKFQSDLLEHTTGDIYLPSSGACEASLLAGKKTTSTELRVEDVLRYVIMFLANPSFLTTLYHHTMLLHYLHQRETSYEL